MIHPTKWSNRRSLFLDNFISGLAQATAWVIAIKIGLWWWQS